MVIWQIMFSNLTVHVTCHQIFLILKSIHCYYKPFFFLNKFLLIKYAIYFFCLILIRLWFKIKIDIDWHWCWGALLCKLFKWNNFERRNRISKSENPKVRTSNTYQSRINTFINDLLWNSMEYDCLRSEEENVQHLGINHLSTEI